MDEIQKHQSKIVITKHDKSATKSVLVKKTFSVVGMLEGSIKIHGDLIKPTGERWEACGQKKSYG